MIKKIVWVLLMGGKTFLCAIKCPFSFYEQQCKYVALGEVGKRKYLGKRHLSGKQLAAHRAAVKRRYPG